jgi:MFS family permease
VLGLAIAALAASLSPLAPVAATVAAWGVAGLGMGVAYAPISVIVLGEAPPGKEGGASAALQLTDTLGVALGAGFGGVLVALGAGLHWRPRTGLGCAFAMDLAVAVVTFWLARRLPRAAPREAPDLDPHQAGR